MAACNSIAGLDAEYELAEKVATEDSGGGTSGGTSGTSGSLDAEPDAPGDADPGAETGPVDGGADVVATDTGVPDSAPDAGAFCSRIDADFCEDFEDLPPRMLPTDGGGVGRWTRSETKGGELSIVDFEGSRALRAEASTNNSGRTLVLWRQIDNPFSGPKHKVTMTFRFKVLKKTIPYAVLGGMQFSWNDGPVPTTREYGLAAYERPRSQLDENEPNDVHDFTGAIHYDKNTWYTGEVVVTRQDKTYWGSVRVKGSAPLDEGVPASFPSKEAPPSLEIGVGFFFAGGEEGEGEVIIDDVVVRRE
jgi:hypothetical protein